ncbi:MAG: radical SAM protein, partial [Desulfovibrionales bacterium]|nr:radical SAM protein [Desulfovibrionales bacterium]
MKIQLVYPSWPKLKNQTEFNLPPHGPVVFAATLPDDVQVQFIDENVQAFVPDMEADLICMSVMLTCALPRAFEIADMYRGKGKTVLF